MTRFFFFLALVGSTWCSDVRDGYYIAAVVEHSTVMPPLGHVTVEAAQKAMMKNVDKYESNIRDACSKDAQIIVFPEDGIYGLLPNRNTILPYLENMPSDDVIQHQHIYPCDQTEFKDRPVLQRLSCLAKQYGIAIVANMGDVQPCHPLVDSNCSLTSRKQYNTDVAFDTDGRLLAKYHKQHLYFENAFDTPETVNYAIFTTSFGVRFGMFTCFDILFEKPAMELVRQYNVTNIVFPTAWINQFPHLVSTEVQQAWSRVTSTNLLAANQHGPIAGFTGSGIYSAGHAFAVFESYLADKEAVLVSTVPRNSKNANSIQFNPDAYDVHDGYHPGMGTMFLPHNQPQFNFQPLSGRDGHAEVCHNDLCCYGNYSRSSDSELYALGAFSGLDQSKPEEYKMQACMLTKCVNSSVSSCGKQVYVAETSFRVVELEGNFSSSAVIFPDVLSGNRNLLPPTEIVVERGKLRSNFTMSSSNPPTLLAATLYGRIFTE